MIAIAKGKCVDKPIPTLTFRAATAEALTSEEAQFDSVIGFNYLHLVRDLPGTLRRIHTLLAAEGFSFPKHHASEI